MLFDLENYDETEKELHSLIYRKNEFIQQFMK